MNAPTKEQLRDPKWWEDNCEPWASVVAIEEDARGGFERMHQRQQAHGSVIKVKHPDNDLTFYERPTRPPAPEWDGEGLPPVGCECERLIGNDVYRVVVVAHFNDEVVVYQEDAAPEYTGVQSGYLRPLRTHEQRVKELVTGLAASAINSRLSIEDRRQSALMLALEELYDAGLLREAGA